MLADDLGYQDLGAWGAEYNTPTLDRLVSRYTKLVNKQRKSQFTPRAGQEYAMRFLLCKKFDSFKARIFVRVLAILTFISLNLRFKVEI